jgi:hypothetical protein
VYQLDAVKIATSSSREGFTAEAQSALSTSASLPGDSAVRQSTTANPNLINVALLITPHTGSGGRVRL